MDNSKIGNKSLPLWKTALLNLSATNMSVIRKPEHRNCIRRQLIYGIFVLISALLVGASAFSISGFVSEVLFVRLFITVISVIMIVLLDNLVLSSTSNLAAFSRIPLLLLISLFVMISALKVGLNQGVTKILLNEEKESNGYFTRMHSINSQIDSLKSSRYANQTLSENLFETYYDELNGFEGADQCFDYDVDPVSNNLIPNPASCPKAFSSYQAWFQKTKEIERQSEAIDRLVTELEELEKAEVTVEPDIGEFISGFVTLFKEKPLSTLPVVLIGLLYLFMEGAPVFIKLTSPKNSYDLEIIAENLRTEHSAKIITKLSKKLHKKIIKHFSKKIRKNQDPSQLKDALSNVLDIYTQVLSMWTEKILSRGQTDQNEPPSETEIDESIEEADSEKESSTSSKRKVTPLKALLLLIFILPLTEYAFGPIQKTTGVLVAGFPSVFMDSTSVQKFKELSAYSGSEEFYQIQSGDGKVLYSTGVVKGEIPTWFKEMLITSENHRFNQFYCIDPIRGSRALYDFVSGRYSGGGSTIPMQLARIAVLPTYNSTMIETLKRKVHEIFVGCALVHELGKEKLLDAYTEEVYLGQEADGKEIHGFPEASWAYFNKPLNRTNKNEAIALISILNGPNLYLDNDRRDRTRYEARYNRVLHFFKKKKIIDGADLPELQNNRPNLDGVIARRESLVYKSTKQAVDLLNSEKEIVKTGVLKSTINTNISVTSFEALKRLTDQIKNETKIDDIEGFVMIAQNHNILSLIGSTSTVNNYTDRIGSWSPASMVKPLLLNEYLVDGGSIADILPNFEQCFDTNWCVSNSIPYFQSEDSLRANVALPASTNVPFAFLAKEGFLEKLTNRLDANETHLFSSYQANALGSESVKPIDFFRAIHTFSEPFGTIPKDINFIADSSSKTIDLFSTNSSKIVAENLAETISQPYGTLNRMEQQYAWNHKKINYLAKTGSGNKNSSAGLFVIRPGGIVLMIGIFSRSGASLVSSQGKGVSGADLAVTANEIMENPEIIKGTRFQEFNFDKNLPSWIVSFNKN